MLGAFHQAEQRSGDGLQFLGDVAVLGLSQISEALGRQQAVRDLRKGRPRGSQELRPLAWMSTRTSFNDIRGHRECRSSSLTRQGEPLLWRKASFHE
jgi:hypothetical protein